MEITNRIMQTGTGKTNNTNWKSVVGNYKSENMIEKLETTKYTSENTIREALHYIPRFLVEPAKMQHFVNCVFACVGAENKISKVLNKRKMNIEQIQVGKYKSK